MKTFLLTALSLLLIVTIAYSSFKRSQNRPLPFNKIHLGYLEETNSDIAAFDSMDALFSRTFKGYNALKENEYRLAVYRGFNTPPSKETYKQLLKMLNAEHISKEDQALCKSVFRAAIIFRILDENTDPRYPSKQEVMKVFWNDVI